MTWRTLWSLALISSLISFSIRLLPPTPQLPWLPCSSLNTPSMLLPQSFCSCCSFFLNSYSPRYSRASLPLFYKPLSKCHLLIEACLDYPVWTAILLLLPPHRLPTIILPIALLTSLCGKYTTHQQFSEHGTQTSEGLQATSRRFS